MNELYTLLSLVAGSAPIEFLTVRLRSFLNLDLPEQTKSILKHYVDCADAGGYPSPDYLRQFSLFSEVLPVINNEAELSVYTNSVAEVLSQYSLRTRVITALNSDNLSDALKRVYEESSVSVGSYERTTSIVDVATTSDVYSGVYEIDDITHGFVGGTVATFAAFTSHGKSTACVSAAYNAMKKGQRVVYFSLELPAMVVIKQFFVRWLFDEHNVVCTFSDLLSGSMDATTKQRVADLTPEFNTWVSTYLSILDESVLTKDFVSDYSVIKSVYSTESDFFGAPIKMVVYDHVGQIELMHPDKGNAAVRNITAAGKSFVNSDGSLPVTLFACQCNRTGYERALRRQGKYDLLAIGDLNEVERSSTYVIFLFKENEAVVQELKVTMAKNRYGALIPEPVSVSFNPAVYTVGSEFTSSSGAGAFSGVFDSGLGDFSMPSFDPPSGSAISGFSFDDF